MRGLVLIVGVLVLAGASCGGAKTAGPITAAQAPPSTSVAGSTATPTESSPASTPETGGTSTAAETLDGRWSGSTENGETFAFTVSGARINNIALPASRCGVGMASRISVSDGYPFKGSVFKVKTPGLSYSVYENSGQSYPARDITVITGVFTSSTDAKGSIVTKVQSNGRTIDHCRQRWTAEKS